MNLFTLTSEMLPVPGASILLGLLAAVAFALPGKKLRSVLFLIFIASAVTLGLLADCDMRLLAAVILLSAGLGLMFEGKRDRG